MLNIFFLGWYQILREFKWVSHRWLVLRFKRDGYKFSVLRKTSHQSDYWPLDIFLGISICWMFLTVASKDYLKTYASLASIPDDISNDVNGVYLYGNQIRAIPADVFSHLAVCTTIDLSENSIDNITADAFNGLLVLQYLHMDQNDLARVQANIFTSLGALRILTIRDNRIKTIEDGAFDGLKKLHELQLQGNEIEVLEPDMFTGLESLKNLSLHRNEIHNIKDGAFAALESLNHLDLSENGLSKLSNQMFTGLIALRSLYLDGNKLSTVSSDAFSHLYRPLSLRLSNPTVPAARRNPLQCDDRLCWLKNEETDGKIKFSSDYKPLCSSGGSWENLSCEEGEYWTHVSRFKVLLNSLNSMNLSGMSWE